MFKEQEIYVPREITSKRKVLETEQRSDQQVTREVSQQEVQEKEVQPKVPQHLG